MLLRCVPLGYHMHTSIFPGASGATSRIGIAVRCPPYEQDGLNASHSSNLTRDASQSNAAEHSVAVGASS